MIRMLGLKVQQTLNRVPPNPSPNGHINGMHRAPMAFLFQIRCGPNPTLHNHSLMAATPTERPNQK